MFTVAGLRWLLLFATVSAGAAVTAPPSAEIANGEELLTVQACPGTFGGVLTVAQRSEPKTLNPVLAVDAPSREVIGRMNADLISTDRRTGLSSSSLAKSWKASIDGRHYALQLRRGLRFSDGQPFDADDVIFSFKVYLDIQVHSPQRDLLTVRDEPVRVRKLNSYSIAFDFAESYATIERVFDGVVILPRHLLEQPYKEGKISEMWGLNVKPSQIAGMGPFRFKEFTAGQHVILERNPYYWKVSEKGQRLPYLDGIDFQETGSEDGQIARFLSGETDVVNRLSSKSFHLLQESDRTKAQTLKDLGSGLEYTFLFFNFKVERFRDAAFRCAISSAIDREAICRLAYGGRATVLSGNVTPGNSRWRNTKLKDPARSVPVARTLLQGAGYRWDHDGKLSDRAGQPVKFSIITAGNNSERLQAATLIQYDLESLGIAVQVVALDFHELVNRVTNSRDFEACLLSLGGGDGDPNSEMNVWLSKGAMHVWDPMQSHPGTTWEAEMDELMQRQMVTRDPAQRKQLYDRVQQIISDEQPIIPLVSPHVLVAARQEIGNFQPIIFDPYTLWNPECLFKRTGSEASR